MENGEMREEPAEAEQGSGVESSEENTWAMAAHLSALVGLIGVPFGNILGPLVIWLVKRDESAFVGDQAKEALNFQISMSVYGVVAAVLVFLLIGLVLLPLLAIAWFVLLIMAAMEAKKGKKYRYPFTFRLIK